MRRICLGLAVLSLVSSARDVRSQTFPTNDPVLRRIWSIGMDSSHTWAMAQVLLDSIGPRLTGTPNQRAGNDWLLSKYRAWGIPARAEQYGTWRGWQRGVTHVDLMQPRVRTLEAHMLAWSPSTPRNEPLQVSTVILPGVNDSAAFTSWLPQVRGKFALISMPHSTCRPDDNWREFADSASFARMQAERTERTRQWNQRVMRLTGDTTITLATRTLMARMEAAGAAGVFTHQWSNGWGVDKIFDSWRLRRIPAVDLSCEDYGLVWRLTENRQNPVLRVQAESQELGEVPVANVIAEIKGSEKPNEYVMLSAHFDSWDAASGATDNATGTLVMLEAMRILKQVYPNPKRTILAGHWSGEEQGLIGSRAFAADHPEIVNGLQALFNQDNGTGRVVNVSASGLVDATGSLAGWLARLPRDVVRHINFGFAGAPASGGSDHAAFVCYGAPGFGLGSLSWDYGTYTWHTNRDTFDKIVWDDLKNNVVLTAMLAYLASEDPQTTPRGRANVFTQGGRPATWPACVTPARKAADWIR
jgi:carboxypeptidase Q